MTATFIVLALILVLIVAAMVGMVVCIRRPKPGEVLIIKSSAGTRVSRGACLVLPFGTTAKCVGLASIPFRRDRSGVNGMAFGNSIRGDLTFRAVVRIANQDEVILELADRLGLKKVGQEKAWNGLLGPQVKNALDAVAGGMNFGDAFCDLGMLREQVGIALEHEFKGRPYMLDAIEIELKRTALDCLDPRNNVDQEGIRFTQAEMAKCGEELYLVAGADREFLRGSTIALKLHPDDLERWVRAAAGQGMSQ